LSERFFGRNNGLRISRDQVFRNGQETSEPFSVREKPCFDLADYDPKAHISSRLWQPETSHRRRTGRVLIQIDEHRPRSELSGLVVATNLSQEMRLSLLAIDWTWPSPSINDKPLENGFVQETFNCP
jgi:hypothetical protein